MGSHTGSALALCRQIPSRVTVSCVSANSPLANDDVMPHDRVQHELEHHLSALQEEQTKIVAFGSQLPLCMQLLQEAIEAYKEQLTLCKPSPLNWHNVQGTSSFDDTESNLESPRDRAWMEEFIPAKRPTGFIPDGEDELPPKMICKPKWMKQCGSLKVEAFSHRSQERCVIDLTIEGASLCGIQEQALSSLSKPYFHSKNKSGGAFMPFSRNKKVMQPRPGLRTLDPTDLVPTPRDEGPVLHVANVMGQSPNRGKVEPKESGQQHPKEMIVKRAVQGTSGPIDSPPARKARRCWSPELHCRFVNALQQLGGSQVATPKQIKDLMKVEGLTTDEVKSHLQKYRLHMRRPTPTPVESTQSAPQLVVLGGLWVPPDYIAHADCHQTSSTLYSQQPMSSQELCSERGQMHHHHHHLHATSCRELLKIAPTHTQCSMQGPHVQLTSHSVAMYHQNENGCEESVDDDGRRSGNSNCKEGQFMLLCKAEEMEDEVRSQGGSINGYQSHCTSEDGDSRGSETNLKMM